jgi:hypothetical protein
MVVGLFFALLAWMECWLLDDDVDREETFSVFKGSFGFEGEVLFYHES